MRGPARTVFAPVPARQVAQARAGTSQIMRGKILDAGTLRSSFHNMPYCLRREPVAPKFAHSIYRTENGTGADLGGSSPAVNRPLNPRRNRDCADMLTFADQIRNEAVLLPDLEFSHLHPAQLGPPQSASDQDRQNRPVSFIAEAVRRRMPQ